MSAHQIQHNDLIAHGVKGSRRFSNGERATVMNGYRFVQLALCTWPLALEAAMVPSLAFSTPVTVDTSAEAGENAYLYFDMDGFGINAATITNLAGESSVISESFTGLASGSLAGSGSNGVQLLVDSTYPIPPGPTEFTEDALNVTLGNTLTFNLQGSNATPISGTDEFAFYITDADGNSLLPTTDPTGAGSLLTLDINGGAPVLTNYSTAVTFTAPVPLPSSLWLMLGSLPLLFSSPRRVKRQWMPAAPVLAGFAGLLLFTAGSAQAQGTPTQITVAGQPLVTGVGLDSHLSVAYSGFRLNHASKAFVTTVTIYNHSVLPINGPFYIGVDSISDGSVSLFGNGILQNGDPFATVGIATIPPGQTVTTSLSFNNPNSVAFTLDAGVYDAASAPPVATLTCPTLVPPNQVIFEGSGTAYPLSYANPEDSIGRLAVCSPASGTNLYSGVSPSTATATATTVICGSTGGPSLPATCSSTIAINWLATTTINVPPPPPPPPYPSNLAIIPCSAMASSFIPGNALPDSQSYYTACGIQGTGTAGFAIWNYGPNDALNASVTFNVPPTVNQLAWQFSSANSCDPAVPYQIAEYFEGRLIGYAPAAHITCHFADIAPNTGVNAIIGEDSATPDVPAIAVSIAVDPTQNTNPDTSDTSIQLNVGPPIESISVPASIKVQPQTCDFSQSPGFEILLNTCGVPPEVDQILVATVLGASLMVAGAGVDFFDLTNITQTIIFKSLETGSYIR